MNYANINHCWSSLIIEELTRLGVDYCCVAPGARSSPLVIAIAQHPKMKTSVHFDERALGFYAMGYAAARLKPAVLICTSGTAAANFLPAIIEASKKKLPLIVITADRPPELRQTGAVQTIDQVGLFGNYVRWAVDMPCPDKAIDPSYVLTTIDQAHYQALHHRGVVHINMMLRPPLSLLETGEDFKTYLKPLARWFSADERYTRYVSASQSCALADIEILARDVNAIKKGVLIVGKIDPIKEGPLVLRLAEKLGWPIFADIASGLRLGQRHAHLIAYFDLLLLSDKILNRLSFDGVVHLGGRMTSQRYYDFIQKQDVSAYIMILNHALRNDPNHQVSLRVHASIGNCLEGVLPLIKQGKASVALKLLSKANQAADRVIEGFKIKDEGLSEISVARLVSQWIPADQGLFLSNSMPIRDMGNYADFKGNHVLINGNRGASGIDGIIASAAGYARGLEKPVTLMIGDLAALHDLNALALLRDLPAALILVLINNGGGGIFSFLPIAGFKQGFEKFWGTPHGYSLAAVASMFELRYSQPQERVAFQKAYQEALAAETSTIIEIITTRDDNFKAHKELERLIDDRL